MLKVKPDSVTIGTNSFELPRSLTGHEIKTLMSLAEASIITAKKEAPVGIVATVREGKAVANLPVIVGKENEILDGERSWNEYVDLLATYRSALVSPPPGARYGVLGVLMVRELIKRGYTPKTAEEAYREVADVPGGFARLLNYLDIPELYDGSRIRMPLALALAKAAKEGASKEEVEKYVKEHLRGRQFTAFGGQHGASVLARGIITNTPPEALVAPYVVTVDLQAGRVTTPPGMDKKEAIRKAIEVLQRALEEA